MDSEELLSYFDDQLFLPDLKATSKDEVLQEIVEHFVEAKNLKNGDVILDMLRQREHLGSTGIGKKVAIPHGRTTSASEIMIAFAAIDDKPVNLIFMIIAPPQDENNMYLPILGKMVEILSKSKNRDSMIKAESFSDFIEIISKG